jgi:hypothetical protein
MMVDAGMAKRPRVRAAVLVSLDKVEIVRDNGWLPFVRMLEAGSTPEQKLTIVIARGGIHKVAVTSLGRMRLVGERQEYRHKVGSYSIAPENFACYPRGYPQRCDSTI